MEIKLNAGEREQYPFSGKYRRRAICRGIDAKESTFRQRFATRRQRIRTLIYNSSKASSQDN